MEFRRDSEFDWSRLAIEVRIKRFGRAKPLEFKEKSRQARFLEYRGFNLDQINGALEFGDERAR